VERGIVAVVADPDLRLEEQIESGALVRVLEDWCQPFPGYFLYPSRRQQPAALSALIDTLRLEGGRRK